MKRRLHTLLPDEPRILRPDVQGALTARYLDPVLRELEACFLEVRQQLDPELKGLRPVKRGKPFPLGQCLEIAEAVQKRLRIVRDGNLTRDASIGLKALRAFQRAGGSFRLVWGDLRGQYFQNAFQVGTLYVDVANDTVIPTKPKVEVLPFERAQLVPIRDFQHFCQIASSYWQHEIFPNHVLPGLAPHCPLIHVDRGGRVELHDATGYMLALTRVAGFTPSELVLRAAPMPQAVFDNVRSLLQAAGHQLAESPQRGRQQALQQCERQRAKRWHLERRRAAEILQEVQRVNRRLASRREFLPISQETFREMSMTSIKIDGIDYGLDNLSAEAKAQLQSIQFVDQEIARLQAQVAAMQTARNAYVNALKAALPKAAGADVG